MSNVERTRGLLAPSAADTAQFGRFSTSSPHAPAPLRRCTQPLGRAPDTGATGPLRPKRGVAHVSAWPSVPRPPPEVPLACDETAVSRVAQGCRRRLGGEAASSKLHNALARARANTRAVRQRRSATAAAASGAAATAHHRARRGPVYRKAARAVEALQGVEPRGVDTKATNPKPLDAAVLVPQEREENPRPAPVRRSRPAPSVQSSADALEARFCCAKREVSRACC